MREFCAETGIEYKCLGFVEGNKEVLGRLGDIGRQAEMLVKCQQYMAETGESGLALIRAVLRYSAYNDGLTSATVYDFRISV